MRPLIGCYLQAALFIGGLGSLVYFAKFVFGTRAARCSVVVIVNMASKRQTDTSASQPKKQRREQSFRQAYSEKYPCIVPSILGKSSARCTLCEIDFSISHGGMDDVNRHVKCSNHLNRGAALKSSGRLTSFFPSSKEKENNDVIRAETLFAHFLVEHNISIAASDHAGPLFRAMFPDSNIAKDYSCARTKTTCIIQECSASAREEVASKMRNGPFIIGTDGSQEGSEKLFPIVVRFLDGTMGEIKTALLANPTCNESSTGENIFKLLDNELERCEVPWQNCLSLVCDNANVMTGINKGVISYVRQKAPNVHLAGCICHLLHLAVKKAIKASSKFDVDDILRQVNWYLSKSSNRLLRLQVLQKECGVPQHKILEHVPTRCLSMGPALARVIEQWKPLGMLFEEEHKKKKEKGEQTSQGIVAQLRDFFRRRTSKLYVLFYIAAIEVCNFKPFSRQ